MGTQSQYFSSYESASAFADAREAAGDEHVTVVSNSPHPGSWRVNYGTLEDDRSFMGLMAAYGKILDEREQDARDAYEVDCRGYGRRAAAKEAAHAAGYEGRDAEVFAEGFSGYSAKFSNPRAEGREGIFREGRKAWGTPAWQRAYRVASVRARSILQYTPPEPFREGGLIANGEG